MLLDTARVLGSAQPLCRDRADLRVHDGVDLDTPRRCRHVRRPQVGERIPGPARAGDHQVGLGVAHQVLRAHGSVEQLRGELGAVRETGERQQAELLRVGTELATATAQLAAARELVETTKTHAAERVADLRRQLDPPTRK